MLFYQIHVECNKNKTLIKTVIQFVIMTEWKVELNMK